MDHGLGVNLDVILGEEDRSSWYPTTERVDRIRLQRLDFYLR